MLLNSKVTQRFLLQDLKHIDDLAKFLNTPSSQLAKTLFYKVGDKKFLCVMIAGDDDSTTSN